MGDALCDYTTTFNWAFEVTPTIAFLQSQHGFYASLLSMEGAIESVKKLICSVKIGSYILAVPSTRIHSLIPRNVYG